MGRNWRKHGEALLREMAQSAPAQGSVYAWCLGQTGYVFHGEVTVAVDVMLNDLTDDAGRSLRLFPAPFRAEDFAPDWWLCTHGHDDHMAMPTITAVARSNDRTRFAVPAGCADRLLEAGIAPERVVPLAAGETVSLPGLTITPVQAAHPVHQLDEQGRDVALCLQLEMNGVRLLHLGDTYMTDQLLGDLRALPRADVLLTPINGGDYFRTARKCIGNLDALESATLAGLLKPALTIPTHFDMIEGNTCSPLPFVDLLWQQDPTACFRIPALGERLLLSAGE